MKPFAVKAVSTTSAHYDIATNEHDQKVALYHISRFWAFDLDKIKVSGMVDDLAVKPHIRVAIMEGGRVVQSARFESSFAAYLQIDALSGSIFDVMGRDIIGGLESAWLKAAGYPEGYPCGTECTVRICGSIDISVTPTN